MPDMPVDGTERVWWRDGVLYQIYPRSYMDANGDGVGDLRGIIARLDHLEWLGVDGIWLNPITASPNDDWGYDVADYCSVDPALGTLADAEELIAEAAERGIRVILDIVPNHTSDRNAWFVDARSSRDAAHRDWYVWADPKPDGSPPNNWVNSFHPGRPAWTFDDTTGQYYLNNFLPSQPDLNWWNNGVRDAFDEILRFWFDRGVAGFRIDVCHMIIKDKDLRDNPPATDADHWYVQLRGQRQLYNAARPEVHDVLRHWRHIAATYTPSPILVGETYVFDADKLFQFYGSGDELNLAFNLMFLHAHLDAKELREIIETAERMLPENCWPTWTAGSHDNRRFPSRWCDNDPRRVRPVLVMLLTLRGTPFLYYGDELGMPDTDVPVDRILDPVGKLHGARLGRDNERTPMHWDASPGGGFAAAGVEPWLPYGDYVSCNVADERDDPDSILLLTRDLIRLRKASADLMRGAYATVATDDDVWAWTRGESTVVACNFSDSRVDVAGATAGVIALSTDRAHDGKAVGATLHLDPWEAVIVERR